MLAGVPDDTLSRKVNASRVVILRKHARAQRARASRRIYAFVGSAFTFMSRKKQIHRSFHSSSSRVAGLGLGQDDKSGKMSHGHPLAALAYCMVLLGALAVFPSSVFAHVNSP